MLKVSLLKVSQRYKIPKCHPLKIQLFAPCKVLAKRFHLSHVAFELMDRFPIALFERREEAARACRHKRKTQQVATKLVCLH